MSKQPQIKIRQNQLCQC